MATGKPSTASISSGVAGVEPLESRRLLAASVAGVLNVSGTDGPDDILVELNAGDPTKIDVTINGATQTFDVDDVESISVRGLAGDDDIDLDASLDDLELETELSGGDGNDTIRGGAGEDFILGGDGDDQLFGNDSEDELRGGPGADQMTGGDGEDVFKEDARAEILDLTGDDGRRRSLANVPKAVRNTITRLAGRNKVFGLFREVDDDGNAVFEAEWLEYRYQRSLKINLKGTVVEDEKEIEVFDLPKAVRDAVKAAYPDGEITEAETALVDGRLLYEVEVEEDNGTVRELLLTGRGTVLDDEVQ